jgi:amino acid adenylation domain-containing protein/non-ribosomal peptide synthase protein (TIGR01720 family)
MDKQLYDRLKNLSPQQRALLAKRFNIVESNIVKPIKVINKNEVEKNFYPLSYSQEHIWLLEELFPGSNVNNIAGVAIHKGEFDLDYFTRAMNIVIARHPSLYTAFLMQEDIPCQYVKTPFLLEPTLYDFTSMQEQEKMSEMNRLMDLQSNSPFDLSSGILLRCVIFRFSSLEHHIFVCMHHIAADGWSTAILLREQLYVYQNLLKKKDFILPVLPIQYTDFSVWQRQQIHEEGFKPSLVFWQKNLTNLLPQLNLPFDKERSALVSEKTSDRLSFEISQALSERIQKFVSAEKVTPFMYFFSIFAVVLHRYSHDEDFAIGVPVAGRENGGVENLIGCFLNLLALRIKLDGEPTFREFLLSVKNVTLEAFEHSAVPFELVVSTLGPERIPGFSPFFQTVFSFEREPTISLSKEADFSIAFHEFNVKIARYDLILELTYDENYKIKGWLDYNTTLFESITIQRLLNSFVVLLEESLAYPDKKIGQLNLLTSEEQKKILVDFNQTYTEYPRNATLPELFFQQVTLNPDAIALIEEGQKITYRELDDRSNYFASYLIQQTNHLMSTIAVYMNKSIDTIVAIVSILKSGCAYLPLNLSDPHNRLLTILSESKTTCILYDEINQTRIDRLEKEAKKISFQLKPILFVFDLQVNSMTENQKTVSRVSATDVAYVMYTSGSTGNPKGVMVTHQNIIRLVKHTNYAAFGPDETGLLLAPLAFDAVTFEIWGILLNGGALVIPQEDHIGFDDIEIFIRKYQITILWLTAGLFQAMVEENLPGLSSLRQLLIGGDVLSKAHVEKFLQQIPTCKLINGYGPTECTTFSCFHLISLEDIRRKSIPIGRPISNTQIYILDANLQPMPIGVEGDLYIGGEGVALGYVNDKSLTEKKFISSPFKFMESFQVTSDNIYFTGDRARYLNNEGLIEFCGRQDQQTKLRGYRIELGEIEAALGDHPAIQETTVIAYTNLSGVKQLSAFLVLKKKYATSDISWQDFLINKIPSYMIPVYFIVVPKLPLSMNGKINKKKLIEESLHLLEPQQNTKNISNNIADMNNTKNEKIIINIWKDLLHRNSIDENDSFFEMGGDSIRAVQMVSRLRQKGLLLRSKDVFDYQTPRALAAIIQRLNTHDEAIANVEGNVPLTPIQEWFFSQPILNYSHWNQWVLYKLSEHVNSHMLEKSLNTVLSRYDVFRMRFEKKDNQWIQFLVDDYSVRVEEIDLECVPFESRENAVAKIINEMHGSLDISHGPLIKSALIKERQNGTLHLSLVVHHLIIDQVSWFHLFEDLQIVLEAAHQKTIPIFNTAPVLFTHYARKLKALDVEHVNTIKHQWESYPWNQPSTVKKKNNQEGNNLHTVQLFDKEIIKKIKLACDVYRIRPDEFLTIALGLTWADFKKTDWVQFDIEQTGRQDNDLLELDIHHSFGWFTSIYPILLNTDIQNMTNKIKSIKTQVREFSRIGFYFNLIKYGILPNIYFDKLIPVSELVFNYLGEIDKHNAEIVEYGFANNIRLKIEDRDPQAQRTHHIIATARIVGDSLEVSWGYSLALHQADEIKKLADNFKAICDKLIHHSLLPEESYITPSDFVLSHLDQTAVDKLIAGYSSYDIEDVYKLSPLQEGLLFYAVKEFTSDTYLVQFIGHMQGDIHIEYFRQAWITVVNRHSALRTAFYYEGCDIPVQIVIKNVNHFFTYQDWSKTKNDDIDNRISEFIKKDRQQLFHLGAAPLIRVCLIKISVDQWRLVLTYHHLIMDGWSMAIVLQEIFKIYDNLKQGGNINLPYVRPYKSFIKALEAKNYQHSLNTWKDYLHGFLRPTMFPQEHPVRTINNMLLDEKTTENLHKIMKKYKLTLATLIQGAWALLLSIYSKSNDILFGSVVAGRPPEINGIEFMVGMFINTIPQRVRIESSFKIIDWLLLLQKQQSDMSEHAYIGLADIQRVSQVPSQLPLFQSVVVIENYPMAQSREKDTLYKFDIIEKVEFPIVLMVIPTNHRIQLKILCHPNDNALFINTKKIFTLMTCLFDQLFLDSSVSVQHVLNNLSLKLYKNPLFEFSGPYISNDYLVNTKKTNVEDNVSKDNFILTSHKDIQDKITLLWQDLLNISSCELDDDFYALGGNSLLLMRMHNRLIMELQQKVSLVELLKRTTIRQLSHFIISQTPTEKTSLAQAVARGQLRKNKTIKHNTARLVTEKDT